jgi:hypothetical protein
MRNILLILFLFLLFSCKKELKREEAAIKYEWNGKSNSGQASNIGLEVTYTFSSNDKPMRIVTDNNRVQISSPIPVEKGFIATLKVKNNCKPLACYIKPVLRIYAGGLIEGSQNYYWYLMKEDSSVNLVDSLTISYIVK